MGQAGLLVWIIIVCFGFGACVGQRLEQRRQGAPALGDGDGLQLSLFLGSLVFTAEMATRAGWLPHSLTASNAIGVGYVVTAGLTLFFIFRLLRRGRDGAA